MAKQLNQSKGEFLDADATNKAGSMAVKLAKAETIIVNQTKQWLTDMQIIDTEVLDKTPRALCKRNERILLIKNIPYSVKEHTLRELFERYGDLKRFLISPFNTLAIAEYESKSCARAALKSLAYHKVNYIDSPLYLEFAPKGFVATNSAKDDKNSQDADKFVKQDDEEILVDQEENNVREKQGKQIYVKNLNFDTREE